ncbi:MAG TPA: hypothetical protein VIL28_12635 [Steroidobacteraceae bacterium]|jgi:hypothetical protein
MPASVVLFRTLLLTSVACGIVGSFIDGLFPSLIPRPLADAFEALPPPPAIALFGASMLFLVTFGGVVTAVIGLYRFQPWARPLALLMTALGLLFYPLLGTTVLSGWAQFFLEISSVLWGAVLAMSYVSSLSTRFVDSPTRDF